MRTIFAVALLAMLCSTGALAQPGPQSQGVAITPPPGVPATGGTYTGQVTLGAGALVGPCATCTSTIYPSIYSDANDTLVVNGSGVGNTGATSLVIEGPAPGVIVGTVVANLAINRVSGTNEEHLNLLATVAGDYHIGQIVTGAGVYHNLGIGKANGTDALQIDTSNVVQVLTSLNLGTGIPITATTNLLIQPVNNIVTLENATNVFYGTRNTSLGTDLKAWVTANVAGGYYVGAANDGYSAFTKGYSIGRGTTYNIANHTWFTSTVAGTAVQQMQLTTTGLNVTGSVTLPGVTTGTNADFVCMSAGNVLTLQTSACTISSLRFKDVLGELDTDRMVADVMALHPLAFKMKTPAEPNADPNYGRPQIGLTAENVAAVDPRIAIYEDDMKTPKSYRQEGVIAALVVTAQRQQWEIRALGIAVVLLMFWCAALTIAVRRQSIQ